MTKIMTLNAVSKVVKLVAKDSKVLSNHDPIAFICNKRTIIHEVIWKVICNVIHQMICEVIHKMILK